MEEEVEEEEDGQWMPSWRWMGEDLNFEAKQVLAGLGRRVEVGISIERPTTVQERRRRRRKERKRRMMISYWIGGFVRGWGPACAFQ